MPIFIDEGTDRFFYLSCWIQVSLLWSFKWSYNSSEGKQIFASQGKLNELLTNFDYGIRSSWYMMQFNWMVHMSFSLNWFIFTWHAVSSFVQVFAAAEAVLWISRSFTTPNNPAPWFSQWGWGIWALCKILLWHHNHPQCLQHCSFSMRRGVLTDDWGCWEGQPYL